MKPKNIKFSKNVIQKISDIDGSTMDKKINNLIDIVEPLMPFVEYNNEYSSMKVYQDTLERIDIFKITSSESRENILTRMLILLDAINSVDEEEWVLFKLTNPYNNLLVIEGQVEVNSKEISFNYRGNVFRGKLPPTYVVNGTDLTKELYLWYDNMDWNEIIEFICNNLGNSAKIEKENYILDVNCS